MEQRIERDVADAAVSVVGADTLNASEIEELFKRAGPAKAPHLALFVGYPEDPRLVKPASCAASVHRVPNSEIMGTLRGAADRLIRQEGSLSDDGERTRLAPGTRRSRGSGG